MKPTPDSSHTTSAGKRILLLATSLILALGLFVSPTLCAQGERDELRVTQRVGGGHLTGTWYLALDAEPFGLPPGATLPGLVQVNSDRTLRILDGGDFGGLPFETSDSVQVGTWRPVGGKRVEAVTLFLQADALDGEVQSWQKVHLTIDVVSRNRAVGSVNVYALPCDGPAPFPIFGCPDPIASAADFVPLPPFDIPIELVRLSSQFVEPD